MVNGSVPAFLHTTNLAQLKLRQRVHLPQQQINELSSRHSLFHRVLASQDDGTRKPLHEHGSGVQSGAEAWLLKCVKATRVVFYWTTH